MAETATGAETPFWLRGNHAPVLEEMTALDLSVSGEIPRELVGLYVRNGPNPARGESSHWFAGDGMLHGIRIEDGRACWYRNRWVRTRELAGEELPGGLQEDGVVDHSFVLANTNIVSHAGRLLALVENGFPTEVTGELETLEVLDFDGRLTTSMTAHPKLCPRTGELHFFGYRYLPPYLTYHVADAEGRLIHSEEIEGPGATMMHDFAITEQHVIFMDLPVVFDVEKALTSPGFPYGWSDDYGARLGVMPRGGRSKDVRWLEIEPCYVFHPWNAYEDGSSLVVDVARYDRLWLDGPETFDPAWPTRFTIDLATGSVTVQKMDDRAVEFPRIDDRRAAARHRFGYAVQNVHAVDDPSQNLLKYDFDTGGVEIHDFGAGRVPGEGVFVPLGEGEDEGVVLTYVYDSARDGSDLVVLDAASFAAAPLATVELPQRVPFGFHGNWVPDAR